MTIFRAMYTKATNVILLLRLPFAIHIRIVYLGDSNNQARKNSTEYVLQKIYRKINRFCTKPP